MDDKSKHNLHYFGTHIGSSSSDIDYLIKYSNIVKAAGGNLVQIFLTIPGEIYAEEKSKSELTRYKKYLEENNMKAVVHSCYCHNLATNWDNYSWWLKNFELEIEYSHYIGALGVVLHFGKKLELSKEEAYNNMYTSLIYVHNRTIKFKDIKIFLETSTGQGSEICFKLEELAHFYKKFSKNDNEEIKERIKLCVDTCHIFSAGYNLKTKNDVKRYLEEFEELIGIRYIKLIHLNDCKVEFGSRVDRHENIGKGYIGLTGLKHFFKYFKKLNIPIVLETPGSGFLKEIKLLKNL